MTKEQAAELQPELLGWSNDGTAEANDIKKAFLNGVDWQSSNFWIDAVENKPEQGPNKDIVSIKVLFWVEYATVPYFGYFGYVDRTWYNLSAPWQAPIHSDKVKYFAYINNPYNK